MRYIILVIAVGLIIVASWPLVRLLMVKMKNAYKKFMGEVQEELEETRKDDLDE